MRKLIALAAVVALALVAVPAALAGNGSGTGTGTCTGTGTGQGGSRAAVANYSLSGTVTAVDNGVVTVTVRKANKAARAYKGKTVDLAVTSTTLYYERTVDGERVAVSLADISAGDRITSSGKLVKATGAFSAKRITIALPIGTCLTN
jgi:hypothetical protein